jgi:hypothetical protein
MWYLKSAFNACQKVQDAVQSRLGKSAILSPNGNDEEVYQRSAIVTAQAQTEPELDALRKRVAELEARLEKPGRRKPSRRKR